MTKTPLEDRIRSDMAEIGQPLSIRSAASIAQQYKRLGYDIVDDEAEALVRKVAGEMNFTVF